MDRFDDVLNECLDWLHLGVDVPACLAHYPQYADRLRPLLKLAADIHSVVTPPPMSTARMIGRQRMLDALAKKHARQPVGVLAPLRHTATTREPPVKNNLQNARYVLRLAFAVVIVAIVAASGSVAASTSSLPGDVLYPVKLAAQQAQIALTFDASTRARLEEQTELRQRRDVQAAQRAGRQTLVELQGSLEQINGNTWVVGGLMIKLEPESTVMGQPQIGAQVVVRGKLPGDGSLVALRLVVSDEGKPPPTRPVSPTVSPGKTPKPTERPEATASPVPALGPEPTETPGPAETVKPTDEPKPTKEVRPTQAPRSTLVPKPTLEPKPTREPRPAKEPKPDKEPRPGRDR